MDQSGFVQNAFKSERLVYRAPEDNEQDRAWISDYIQNDPSGAILSNYRLPLPRPLSATQEFLDYSKTSFVAVLICLPVEDDVAAAPLAEGKLKPKPKPIGYISLIPALGRDNVHHRNASIAVGLAPEQRGRGYGGEAINWILDYGFRRLGLHRAGISAFSFNEAGLKLYRKLGFKDEGVTRESVYLDRKFYDVVNLGMLEHEWEELRGIKP
jgi:RimJ/RimL family protein N-acetyltransferase